MLVLATWIATKFTDIGVFWTLYPTDLFFSYLLLNVYFSVYLNTSLDWRIFNLHTFLRCIARSALLFHQPLFPIAITVWIAVRSFLRLHF